MFFKSRSIFSGYSFSGILSSRGKKSKRRKAVAVLMLTSLIDAFSILVVYLLMFFSDTGEMAYVSSDINLPQASSIDRLDRYSIIQVKGDGYFVEEKKLDSDSLVSYLVGLKKRLNLSSGQPGGNDFRETITIQADKAVKYRDLSPIIQACSHAGFSHIKFAVLAE